MDKTNQNKVTKISLIFVSMFAFINVLLFVFGINIFESIESLKGHGLIIRLFMVIIAATSIVYIYKKDKTETKVKQQEIKEPEIKQETKQSTSFKELAKKIIHQKPQPQQPIQQPVMQQPIQPQQPIQQQYPQPIILQEPKTEIVQEGVEQEEKQEIEEPQKKPSAYNMHISSEILNGKTFKQAVASWRKRK